MEGEKRRSGCKGCLVTIAIFAAAPVLLFVGYVAWGLWANARADRESAAVCASIKLGDTRNRVLEMAKGEHAPGNLFPLEDNKGYHFLYYGMIYTARECKVTIEADRVVAKELIAHDD